MQNVNATVKGNTLTITVDLSQRLRRSKTGLTEIIATTGGNATPPGVNGVRFGLNVFTEPPPKAARGGAL